MKFPCIKLMCFINSMHPKAQFQCYLDMIKTNAVWFPWQQSKQIYAKPFENKTNEISVIYKFVHDVRLGAETCQAGLYKLTRNFWKSRLQTEDIFSSL